MDYTQKSSANGVYTVSMRGKFTFGDHNSFKHILELLTDPNLKQLELDFSEISFVDSAALGVILIAKDEAEKKGKQLVIFNPVGQVKKMFEISRFYDLFEITH